MTNASTKRRACVMGHPVAHSRSPMLHGYWLRTLGLDGSYEFADVAPENFEEFFRGLKANGFAGGNITQPHKEAAFRLVDRRERAADKIGAVNTVWYEGDTLIGGNTDWLGLVEALDGIHPGWDAKAGKVVVLGAGGSARTSVFAFTERKFSVSIVNRTLERAHKLAGEFAPHATPYGYDALPITADTIEATRSFLSMLPGTLGAPYISPGADGTIGLEWIFKDERSLRKLFLDVGPFWTWEGYWRRARKPRPVHLG